ncbi:MAG: hypothetical protein GKR94_02400 [Gammaproteobacteria bacterium]|nr:hypothetical protein [Gammaproteobacteria bacterium]
MEEHIHCALDLLCDHASHTDDHEPHTGETKAASLTSSSMPWIADDAFSALGLAERVTEGQLLTDLALKVYVQKKLPKSRCSNPVPSWIEVAGLPPIPTDVEEVGKIQPHSNIARVRPAPPGFSIGRSSDRSSTATFGLVVRKKGQDAPLYLLSNSHAIANSGLATKGEQITQPGAFDGGSSSVDTIAQLSDWVPFVFSKTGFPNLLDAAIAELDPDVTTSAIAQLGIPVGVSTQLTRGMEVQKMGRTTTFSIAKIKDVNVRLPTAYPTAGGGVGRVGFSDQVMTSFYSAPGDSGSAVLNMRSEVVGMHFAGSNTVGVFNKITNVLDQLGLAVVTADADPQTPRGA